MKPTDYCAECGRPLKLSLFGSRKRCCNGMGYWSEVEPRAEDGWLHRPRSTLFSVPPLYLYVHPLWPKRQNPALPDDGTLPF